jgi:RNA polymerase sigma-70 factor (ECF subfamily)
LARIAAESQSQRDIEQLVRDAKAGDARAFDALVDLYADRIYRFVRSRVAASDAEDVTQRVFVRMIEGLPRYEERGVPFGAWLFRIARNTIVDDVRERRDDVPLDVAIGHEHPAPGPAEFVASAAGNAAVRVALAYLPADQRDVLALRFFGDLSTREIAAALGKPEGSVRVLQFRALRAMRRRLEPRMGGAFDRVGGAARRTRQSGGARG